MNDDIRNEGDVSIGDFMKQDSGKFVRQMLLFFSAIVYLGGIIYAEVHGYNLMRVGVNPDMLMWATLGIISLGISAVIFPLALHEWFFDTSQRYVGIAFYVLDLALLFFNALADYSFNRSIAMPGWLQTYVAFAVPVTPIIAACMWTVLWTLDPGAREKAFEKRLKVATRMTFLARAAKHANGMDISSTVDTHASDWARQFVESTIGSRKALPAPQSPDPYTQLFINPGAQVPVQTPVAQPVMVPDEALADRGGGAEQPKRKVFGKFKWDNIRPRAVQNSSSDVNEENEEMEIRIDTAKKKAHVTFPNHSGKA